MEKSNYNKKLKVYGRHLRKAGTPGEAVLWAEVLSAKKFYGLQFNRQFAIENFIVDFICRKLRLVIEVDGMSHQFKIEEDVLRDIRLRQLGYEVVRINESDVMNDLDNVIRTLEACLPEEVIKGQSP